MNQWEVAGGAKFFPFSKLKLLNTGHIFIHEIVKLNDQRRFEFLLNESNDLRR